MLDALRVLRLPIPKPGEPFSSPTGGFKVAEFDLISLHTIGTVNPWEAILDGLYIYECRYCVGCGCEAFSAKDGIPDSIIEQLRWHAATCEGKR